MHRAASSGHETGNGDEQETASTNGNLTPKKSTERSRKMRVKLQKLREAYGFTQQSFSEALGISRSHYSQIETGEKAPSLRLALRIKKALNYQGDDIFDNRTR